MLKLTAPSIAILTALPFAAIADAPAFVPMQGYLTDAAGAPVDAEVSFGIALYTSAVGGSAVFTETQTVLVERGAYHLDVGASQPLDLSLFRDNVELYVGISIDGDAQMSPRLVIGSTPYAGFAQHADDSATVGGRPPADFRLSVSPVPWADIDAVPADLADGDDDSLAQITCAPGAVLERTATGWDCGTNDGPLTETQVDAFVANNGFASLAALAAVASSGQFTDLIGVPADLSDGDDDSLGALSCSTGQVTAWDGSAWRCVTTADALGGLICSAGQVVTWNGAAWACAADADALTTLACAARQRPDWDGSSWGCAADADTIGNLGCNAGQIAAYDGSNWTCVSDADVVRNLNCSTGESVVWDGADWICGVDTLAALPCGLGQIASFDGAGWTCTSDADALSALGCAAGQLPRWDGASWACAADALAALSCAAGQIAKWDGASWACAADALAWRRHNRGHRLDRPHRRRRGWAGDRPGGRDLRAKTMRKTLHSLAERLAALER